MDSTCNMTKRGLIYKDSNFNCKRLQKQNYYKGTHKYAHCAAQIMVGANWRDVWRAKRAWNGYEGPYINHTPKVPTINL